MEVDAETGNESQLDSVSERVVELLNDAIISSKESDKVKLLQQVQELVIHHDILDNFLDEVLGFQNDKSQDVRKFVVGFIEASCKKDPDFFSKLIINLNYAISDENANVVKRAIQATTQLYKAFLKWISSQSNSDEVVASTWEVWGQIKLYICALLDSSDNEGIKTQCIKFMEMVVIAESKKDQWSSLVTGDDDFNVENLSQCKLVDVNTLEEEAKNVFEQLIIFHGAAHISSVNLMATMQSLVLIARSRSRLGLSKVISALEALHANLPPTLAKSQVSSVRKFLKLQLAILLKHPAAATSREYQSQIVELLTDLGATQSEINKCLQEVRKRGLKVEQSPVEPKRIKLEAADEKKSEPSELMAQISIPKITRNEANTAIDITAEDLSSHLSILHNVSDLVLVSLLSLPDSMPAQFQATYTPVAAAGTESQIKHLSRLISTQLTAAGLGKGVQEMVTKLSVASSSSKSAPASNEQQQRIATIVSRGIAQEVKKQEQQQHQPKQLNTPSKVKLIPTGKAPTTAVRMRQFSLSEVTNELSKEAKRKLVLGAVDRVLKVDESRLFLSSGQMQTRTNILTHLATEFSDNGCDVAGALKNHVFEDFRNRYELLFSMLYNEFVSAKVAGNDLTKYNRCLVSILNEIFEGTEPRDREHFLPKFYAEAPFISRESLEILKLFITGSVNSAAISEGMGIIKLLLENRRAVRADLMEILLDLCLSNSNEIRIQAVKIIKHAYDTVDEFKAPIKEFALRSLKYLLNPVPPAGLLKSTAVAWNDDLIKMCLMPLLSLLPANNQFIHDLAEVYVGTIPDIKRVILRALEAPVKGMAMNSPELLLFVENCPKGSETLVTRVIHVLTDKQSPSAELVSRVRDLYHKRVPDVRFLIPVLNGLAKKEVIAALPKLIKLNPVVVKEVFNRLLGINNASESGSSTIQSPLTPTELLIALHNIKPIDCDMKTTIKATSLCFSEKSIYTAEVLAVVMQQLADQNPLPTLLMRTVIQSLSLYPVLIGNVMGILHRLSLKKVWTDKKIWEGFIKCCQRTKPRSFQVLFQLPPPQLQTVFDSSPDFKPALQQHIESLTDTQRAHIPNSVLEVILSESQPMEVISSEEQVRSLPPQPQASAAEEDASANSMVALQKDDNEVGL